MIYVVSGPGSMVYECTSEAEATRIASLDANAGVFVSLDAAERYATVHQPAPPTPEGALAALRVAAMLADCAGERAEIRRAAAALGSSRSPAKTAASRANGKRGGRPRKERS